ncbi:diguanylate cyclase/phosphodiesterase (GGDEF & EAL domains) with PAS/PAC sensor(s) [Dissulfuribacter thermophilus]|uniref:diguanylate cyclase n=1 Tax=Dissulfuribacter thermophilus TaxID=1156395 RepID=A0A1B9F911_9BACT|nr:GGDEF domain-containing protein [Dissulfuribacter thermophilus]OCC16396.1 diguanylate cyclase/phosphodiesterase (GGDEF & EAL domains) with PAS/PAC sensor(s) [Dissulfuribacter thermophilus]
MKVLLSVKNKKNLELLVNWISTKYQVAVMEKPEDIGKEFDLLIVDGQVFEEHRELIKSRKEAEGPVFLPVLLVTNREKVRYITNQLWVTLDEIILTPIEKVELAARIEILLRARRLSLETQLMALTDPLTGIHNRRHFFVVAEREMQKLRRKSRSAACLLIDIDHFKAVNDVHGHLIGDQVLIAVAQRIKSCVRDFDLLARFGGEEFVLFLVETDLPGAIKVAERVRKEVAKSPIRVKSGEEIPITVSIGVSAYDGDDLDVEGLVEQADIALYHAKRTGRNRVMTA